MQFAGRLNDSPRHSASIFNDYADWMKADHGKTSKEVYDEADEDEQARLDDLEDELDLNGADKRHADDYLKSRVQGSNQDRHLLDYVDAAKKVPTDDGQLKPSAMSASDKAERDSKIRELLTLAGCEQFVESLIASDVTADKAGTIAVAMTAGITNGVDFCDIYRGEFREVIRVGLTMTCTEEEYVQVSCEEHGHKYFKPGSKR